MTAPAILVLPPATTITSLFPSLLISASTPASVTATSEVPPPSKRSPDILTTLPCCPISGSTVLIIPAARYAHPSASTLIAPELLRTYTSTVSADPSLAAATTVTSAGSSPEVMFALKSPNLTISISVPADPPRRSDPFIVTFVPRCPLTGFTLLICDGDTYVQADFS